MNIKPHFCENHAVDKYCYSQTELNGLRKSSKPYRLMGKNKMELAFKIHTT